jgi:hypothetical protein
MPIITIHIGRTGHCSSIRPSAACIHPLTPGIRVLRWDRLGGLIHEYAQVV